jgi:hypothetical protein
MSIGVIHSADEPALLFGHLQSLARHRPVAVPFRGKAVYGNYRPLLPRQHRP